MSSTKIQFLHRDTSNNINSDAEKNTQELDNNFSDKYIFEINNDANSDDVEYPNMLISGNTKAKSPVFNICIAIIIGIICGVSGYIIQKITRRRN